MSNLTVILGMLGVVALIFYLANSLSSEGAWLWIMRIILVLLGMVILLYVIPKAILDANNVCQVVEVNETLVAGTTTFNYELQCYALPYNTASVFYRAMIWVFRLVMSAIIVYFLYSIGIWFYDYLKGQGR